MNSAFSLKNRNIIITGASSGIGRECAILASNYGANIILIGRNKERLQETHEQLSEGRHLEFSCDITNYEKLEDIVTEANKKCGKISGFVHSAGIDLTIPLKSMCPGEYEKIFSLNVVSAFELARIISRKKYLSVSGASFVFVSSIMSIVGQPGRIGYCSSKAALISGARAMALELIPKKVRVNCVSPAVVDSEMTRKFFKLIPAESKEMIVKMHPLGIGKPIDVAYSVLYLLSNASAWVTGTNLVIDGGYTAR